MAAIVEALHSGRVLLMDGAMGTELQRAGIREGDCYEEWNLSRPDAVLAIHKAHVKAGANVVLTNTFQANAETLAKYGLAHRTQEIFQAAIRLARVATPPGYVLADIGPSISTDPESLRRMLNAAANADA